MRTSSKHDGKTVYLVRMTNWKCGYLERLILECLREKHPFGVSIRELRERFGKTILTKETVADALSRLSKRRIVDIK